MEHSCQVVGVWGWCQSQLALSDTVASEAASLVGSLPVLLQKCKKQQMKRRLPGGSVFPYATCHLLLDKMKPGALYPPEQTEELVIITGPLCQC